MWILQSPSSCLTRKYEYPFSSPPPLPFSDCGTGLVFKIIRGIVPPLPPIYSSRLRNLTTKMLSKSPAGRPSVSAAWWWLGSVCSGSCGVCLCIHPSLPTAQTSQILKSTTLKSKMVTMVRERFPHFFPADGSPPDVASFEDADAELFKQLEELGVEFGSVEAGSSSAR